MDWRMVCNTLDEEIASLDVAQAKMVTETGRYGVLVALAVLKPLCKALRSGLPDLD